MRHDLRLPPDVLGGSDSKHRLGADRRRARKALNSVAIGLLDRLGAGILLILLSPLIIALAVVIMLDSPGPPFFRCRRLGYRNREFGMVKFRKMDVGAAGLPLTSPNDDRFTRLGGFLSKSKLDEIPQLWNVLRGEMSLVGPRPEDRRFVELQAKAYATILNVKPGITCLSQIAFVRESEILDPADRERQYLERVLPQKVLLDQLYAEDRSFRLNVRILVWTFAAVVFHRQVAVHRDTGCLTLRRRPAFEPAAQQLEAA